MGNWSGMGRWVGNGLRREAFFFPSGGVELYGSLYAAESRTRGLGIVVCGSWGVEADRSDPLAHGVALAAARLGGAGLIFHYPGFGDSHGELDEVTLESLAAAGADAVEQGVRRAGAGEWLLAGFTFGAAVACVARERAARRGLDAPGLLLLQPALRPAAYLADAAWRAERVTFGTADAVTAFGYPMGKRIIERGEETDAAVAEALARFDGSGAEIRYGDPDDRGEPPLPEAIESISLRGRRQFASRSQPGMLDAATEWLDRCPLGAGVGSP